MKSRILRATDLRLKQSFRQSDGEALALVGTIAENFGSASLRVERQHLLSGHRQAPAHRHSLKVELLFVLSGEVEVNEGGKAETLLAGDSIQFLPGGNVFHEVWNRGSEPAKLLSISTDEVGDEVDFKDASGSFVG